MGMHDRLRLLEGGFGALYSLGGHTTRLVTFRERRCLHLAGRVRAFLPCLFSFDGRPRQRGYEPVGKGQSGQQHHDYQMRPRRNDIRNLHHHGSLSSRCKALQCFSPRAFSCLLDCSWLAFDLKELASSKLRKFQKKTNWPHTTPSFFQFQTEKRDVFGRFPAVRMSKIDCSIF